MFEGRLLQGSLLKKILEAVKDLVSDANFNCNEAGIKLQAMDGSHVALISMELKCDGFDHFRCDRNLVLGININNMSKMLKCAGNDDIITLKAEDEADVITFMFESPDQEKVADFEMKLMDIDAEELGIPETEYEALVTMPSTEFQRICRDLASIGDTVVIGVTKEGISFSTGGDIGKANVVCRQSSSVEKEEDQVSVQLNNPVSLTFALRYLNNFTKATSLSPTVRLSLSKDLPITVEYDIEKLGHLRFYLAPKIEEDEGLEEVGEN